MYILGRSPARTALAAWLAAPRARRRPLAADSSQSHGHTYHLVQIAHKGKILEKRSNLGVPLGFTLCKSSGQLFLFLLHSHSTILLVGSGGGQRSALTPSGDIVLKRAEPASAPSSSRVAASCPLQAIQEQATLEDSPHVGQSHRRVHVLALQPLPTARARSAVRPASSQRLRGTLRRQQPSSERRRRSRSPAACARYVTSLDPRTRQNGRQASSEPVRAPV